MKPHLNDMEEATDMSAAGALEEKASETVINLSKPSVRDSKETVACCDSPLNKHSDNTSISNLLEKKDPEEAVLNCVNNKEANSEEFKGEVSPERFSKRSSQKSFPTVRF